MQHCYYGHAPSRAGISDKLHRGLITTQRFRAEFRGEHVKDNNVLFNFNMFVIAPVSGNSSTVTLLLRQLSGRQNR